MNASTNTFISSSENKTVPVGVLTAPYVDSIRAAIGDTSASRGLSRSFADISTCAKGIGA